MKKQTSTEPKEKRSPGAAPREKEEPAAGGGSHNDRLKQSKSGRIKKTRRKELALMGSAAILLLALFIICLLLFFKVQEVRVVDSAQQRYTEAEVIEASGVRAGDSMLWLKEESAAQKILEALPFLAQAEVRKKFPSAVEITVTYARPAMAIAQDGGYILLSAEGKVLQAGVTALADDGAELRGAAVKEAVPGRDVVFTEEGLFEQVTALTKAFADAGYLNVTVYDVSDLQNITVEVEYKVDVKLGSISRVEGKLAFGKEVIERSLADAKYSASKVVVDLTNENRAYVRSQADIDAAASRQAEENAAREAQTNADGTPVEADEEDADGYGYDDEDEDDNDYDYEDEEDDEDDE